MTNAKQLKSAFVLGILFLLITSVGAVRAQGDDGGEDDDTTVTTEPEEEMEHEPEEYRDANGTVWIQTDIMTVMLNPETPTYQFWYTSDNNGSLARFMVAYRMIVEFEDLNGDGFYQVNETIGFVPLEAFEWSIQTGTLQDEFGNNAEVYASYTKGGLSGSEWENDWYEDWLPDHENESSDDNSSISVLAGDDGYPDPVTYEGMTVQFYAHMYMNNYTGNVTDDGGVKATYTVLGGVELKIDVAIGNFPFQSGTSQIALLNYLKEDIASGETDDHSFRLHEGTGDEEHDSEDDSGSGDGLTEDFDDDESDDIQDISLIQASTNTTQGFYKWLDKAVMTLPDESTVAVDVKASYWTDGRALLLFFAYPNFDNGSIMHDPSIGVNEAAVPNHTTTGWGPEIYLATGVVAAIVVLGLVYALKRR